jgi:hypothetical protein
LLSRTEDVVEVENLTRKVGPSAVDATTRLRFGQQIVDLRSLPLSLANTGGLPLLGLLIAKLPLDHDPTPARQLVRRKALVEVKLHGWDGTAPLGGTAWEPGGQVQPSTGPQLGQRSS